MKRALCILLSLILILLLTACGGGGDKKGKPTVEEIVEALDKAEDAKSMKALIDSMEGYYEEDEPIVYEGETITLGQIRAMYELMAAFEGITDDTEEEAGEPVTGDALAAVGTWVGAYGKFVGDSAGNADEEFTLVLKDNGTGTHSRDDLEIPVTWTLNGKDFAMTEKYFGVTLDYTGTLENGELHLFNGDPTNDFTYEYVYGFGDASGIEVPQREVDLSGLAAFRGDWNGALGFRNCTGNYEDLNDENTAAIARFAVQSDGSIEPFIGIDVEDTPFVDLTATYDDFWEELKISGSWINVSFENIPVTEYDGTLHIEIPIEKETGSLELVINLRRLDDEGWTYEDPGLSKANIEYCKGMTFGELASLIGYDFWDYPSPDEG